VTARLSKARTGLHSNAAERVDDVVNKYNIMVRPHFQPHKNQAGRFFTARLFGLGYYFM
jgi:hypothetical protein